MYTSVILTNYYIKRLCLSAKCRYILLDSCKWLYWQNMSWESINTVIKKKFTGLVFPTELYVFEK